MGGDNKQMYTVAELKKLVHASLIGCFLSIKKGKTSKKKNKARIYGATHEPGLSSSGPTNETSNLDLESVTAQK